MQKKNMNRNLKNNSDLIRIKDRIRWIRIRYWLSNGWRDHDAKVKRVQAQVIHTMVIRHR